MKRLLIVLLTLFFISPVWAGPDYTSSLTGAEVDTGITKTGYLTVTGTIDLDGIEAGATANSADATLLNRDSHTGTQPTGTILVAADERIVGRVSGAGGTAEELTPLQVLTMIGIQTGTKTITSAAIDDWLADPQTATVTLENTLADTDYHVIITLEDADDIAAVGVVYAYDKSTTDFKVAYTGGTDNVDIWYTVIYNY